MRKPLELAYINTQGKVIDFTTGTTHAESNAMRGYSWDYTVSRNKVREFKRTPAERQITAWIDSTTASLGFQAREELLEATEYDVVHNTPGTFLVNGWTCQGFIVASEPQGYISEGQVMTTDLKVLLPNPVWIKEEKHQFLPMTDTEPDGLDFPFDFPFDLGAPPPSRTLSTGAEFPSDFKIVVYGGEAGVSNPSVRIGRNLYQVYVDVPPSGYLIIDSHKKAEIGESIQLIDNTGMVFNAMDLRNKGIPKSGEYIFEKIPSGQHLITTNGNFGFDITLYLERSAPPWTSS